ncbi:MAG TPA: hypothetical protein VFS10_07165, partial [Pyrinomonadaceae bacterium]|nr:hypothetical protein [Pyrinomonadaceae bacterium]
IERARRIGREIAEALKGRGFKVNPSIRTWSSSNVDELRRLPKSSAILGLVFSGGGKPSDAAPHVTGYEAEVVIVGDGVIVLEVAEE